MTKNANRQGTNIEFNENIHTYIKNNCHVFLKLIFHTLHDEDCINIYKISNFMFILCQNNIELYCYLLSFSGIIIIKMVRNNYSMKKNIDVLLRKLLIYG
jgi:hypothetical protein